MWALKVLYHWRSLEEEVRQPKKTSLWSKKNTWKKLEMPWNLEKNTPPPKKNLLYNNTFPTGPKNWRPNQNLRKLKLKAVGKFRRAESLADSDHDSILWRLTQCFQRFCERTAVQALDIALTFGKGRTGWKRFLGKKTGGNLMVLHPKKCSDFMTWGEGNGIFLTKLGPVQGLEDSAKKDIIPVVTGIQILEL